MSDKPLEVRAEIETKPNRLDIRIFQEPEEDILLLGEMMHDVSVIHSMLASLPKSAKNYRGNLIVCRGAAERLKQRCTRLLGDGESRLVPTNDFSKSRKASPAGKK